MAMQYDYTKQHSTFMCETSGEGRGERERVRERGFLFSRGEFYF